MGNWKVPAIIAGGAFLLSFLIGLFSGALFGIILGRALVFGLLGGALAVGVPILVDRFLPSLDEGETPEPTPSVDIVLGPENPHTDAEGDFIEEVAEGPAESREPEGDLDSMDSLPEGEAETVSEEPRETVVEAERPAETEAEPAKNMSGLPSLDDFEDSFAPGIPSVEGVGGGSTPGGMDSRGGFADTVTLDGVEEDPRELAKAVQTIIKKDQEG